MGDRAAGGGAQWQPFSAVHPTLSSAPVASTSMLPPAPPLPRSPSRNAGVSSSRHAPSGSITSTASHSQLAYQPQPTRSGRLPVPPRQDEINAMLSMDNYFEFPSESESDDEDFVPAANDETPTHDEEATPDVFNVPSTAYTGPATRSSPLRASASPRKGKKRASEGDTGYSSAAEIVPMDSNEYDWLLDQLKCVEAGQLPPLPPYAYTQMDLGNASEADADAENESSPAKAGEFNSPADANTVGGFYTSWPEPISQSAQTIFAPADSGGKVASTQASTQASTSAAVDTQAQPAGAAEPAIPVVEIVRKRGSNGKFTKAGRKGKNKPVREEIYVNELQNKQTRSQSVREDSVVSLADSDMTASASIAADASSKPLDPYTQIVPKKRGRAKNPPLSPRAEAAQIELRKVRHLEHCDTYRERRKMKAENFEKRCHILEEQNAMLAEENRLLRQQIDTLREERERDRKALVLASRSRKRPRHSAAADLSDSDDGRPDKENERPSRSSGGNKQTSSSALSMEDVGKFVTIFMGMQKAQQAASSAAYPMPAFHPHPQQPQSSYQPLSYAETTPEGAYANMQSATQQQYPHQQGQQASSGENYTDHAAAQAMLGMFAHLQQAK